MPFAGRFSLHRRNAGSPPELREWAGRRLTRVHVTTDDDSTLLVERRAAPRHPFNERAFRQALTTRDSKGLRSLAGDWVALLHDRRAATVTLAVAPLSELNLFYRGDSASFAVATDLADLVTDDAVDLMALRDRFIPEALRSSDQTMFAAVRRLLPGTVARASADGVQFERYWSLDGLVTHDLSIDEAGSRLRDALEQAVADRIALTDGGIGSMLSAGRDSSAVTALAASQLTLRSRGLDAWTACAFSGPETSPRRWLDESPIARRTAAGLPNARHHCRQPAPLDLCTRLDTIHRAVLQPIAVPVSLAWSEDLWTAAAGAGNRLLLSGTFGNYALSAGGLEFLDDVRIDRGVGRWLAKAAALFVQSPGASRSLGGAMLGQRWRTYRRPRIDAPIQPFLRGDLADAAPSNRESADPNSYRQWLRDGIPATVESNELPEIGRNLTVIDPTRDRAVVELVHRLPSAQLASTRDRRPLFDAAFDDLLPLEVRQPSRRGLQNVDWHASYTPADLRAGIARYRQSPAASALIDLDAVDRAIDRWPSARTLSGPVYDTMVWGVLPALSLASFLYTRDT